MNSLSKLIKNMGYSLFANGINLLVSIILMLFVPRLFGVNEYGFWQLYIFYGSYISFFHLGWPDGVLIKYGGQDYKDLQNDIFRKSSLIFITLQTLLTVILLILSYFIFTENLFIFIAISFSIFIMNVRTYNLYVLQATNLVKEFSKVLTLSNLLLVIFFLITLFLNSKIEYLIIADVLSKFISLLYSFYLTKDIYFTKNKNTELNLANQNHKLIGEIGDSISTGAMILFSHIMTLLTTGIFRFFIEKKFGIEYFAQISIAFSISNTIIIFTNALSVAVFPALKKSNQNNYSKFYMNANYWFSFLIFLIPVIYFVGKPILEAWLPNYSLGISFLTYLFPISIFTSIDSLLNTLFLKAMRKERTILIINCISVLLSFFLSILTVYIFESIVLTAVAILIVNIFKTILGEVILYKVFQENPVSSVFRKLILTVLFVFLSSLQMNIVLKSILYLGSVIILFKVNRNKIIDLKLIFRKTNDNINVE